MRQILITTIIFLFTIILSLIFPSKVLAKVVINEVHPNPDSAYDSSEWVELHNYSSSAVNLSGWEVNDVDIPDITIASDEFIVLSKNIDDFLTEFGEIENVYEWNLSLPNSGRSLTLKDGTEIIDEVSYGNTGSLESWERTGPSCSNFIKGAATPGVQNSVADVDCYLPSAGTEIKFSDDNQNWLPTLTVSDGTSVRMQFDISINFTEFEFRDFEDQIITNPHEFSSYSAPVKLVLSSEGQNRVFYSGKITAMPEIKFSEINLNQPQWIEIKNDNSEIDTSELQIKLNGEIVATNTEEIDMNAFGILEAEGLPTCQQPGNCANRLQLVYRNIVVDEVIYEDWIPGLTIVVENSDLIYSGLPTPAEANRFYQPTADLLITEVFPSPDTAEQGSFVLGREWIEIYNNGSQSIDLSLVRLQDAGGEQQLSGTLEPGSHKLIDELDIRLTNSGEELKLVDILDIEIDSIRYPEVARSHSYARKYQNGYLDEWQVTDAPTPGERNIWSQPAQSPVANDTVAEESVSTTGQGATVVEVSGPDFQFGQIEKYGDQFRTESDVKLLHRVSFDPLLLVRYLGITVLAITNLSQLSPILIKILAASYDWWASG